LHSRQTVSCWRRDQKTRPSGSGIWPQERHWRSSGLESVSENYFSLVIVNIFTQIWDD
jgi:hypothetical protein